MMKLPGPGMLAGNTSVTAGFSQCSSNYHVLLSPLYNVVGVLYSCLPGSTQECRKLDKLKGRLMLSF